VGEGAAELGAVGGRNGSKALNRAAGFLEHLVTATAELHFNLSVQVSGVVNQPDDVQG
jgi:hypothetical protein